MRRAFIRTLAELAETDERIVLLTGDLGYLAIEPFAERFPQRFLNAGVAEQNMIGVATGLAEAGYLPFVYSIATFASLRPYEFIRNGPVIHHLPVRIVGVGGGFEYGLNGMTHFPLEDIGVMRLQPNLTVLAPADYEQARNALLATWDLPGPIYYRVGKDEQTLVPGLNGRFRMDAVEDIRDGSDVLIVTMGSISSEAATAAERLAVDGISCAVSVISCLNPLPYDDLAEKIKHYPCLVTAEPHYRDGGIGTMICEIVAERNLSCTVSRCGVGTALGSIVGKQDYLNGRFGISGTAIADTVRTVLRRS